MTQKENLKVLMKPMGKYRLSSARLYVYLTRQQIVVLKGAYGERVAIIYGEQLRKGRLDKLPGGLVPAQHLKSLPKQSGK